MLHGDSGLDEIFAKESRFEEDTSETGLEVKKKVSIARGSLILDQPFFGYLLGQFEIIPVKEKISTFAADNNHLYFNTDYFDDLIRYNENWKGKIKGILIHLLIHIIFRHHTRQEDKIPLIWGYATDIIVFYHLRQITNQWIAPGDWDIPDLQRVPEELLGHSAEKTYQLLMDQLNEETEEDRGRGAGDEDEENQEMQEDPNLDDFQMENKSEFKERIGLKGNECDINEVLEATQNQEIDELEEQYFEGMLRTAYSRQKGFGSLPEGLDRFVSNRLEPQIDWKARLSKYLQQILVHDLTWTRPNKRMYSQGYYFPGPLKENTTVMLAVDTSGSIGDEILAGFLSEAQSILETITNVKLVVVDCDAEVQQITEYEAGEALTDHTFKGKGGTDFRPVFELSKEYPSDVIVYITDGKGTFPERPGDIPVVWALTEDRDVPFGQKVLIK